MMKIFQYIFILSFFITFLSCSDEDYRDLNPTQLLDSPAFLLSTNKGDTIKGGEEITFTIKLIESPAGYDSVSVATTRDEGTFTVNGFDQLKGKTGSGEFTVTVTPPPSFTGSYDVTISVYDAQRNDKGDLSRKDFSETESFFVEYPLELPFIDFSLDGAAVKGKSVGFSVKIAAPGGIDTVVVIPGSGEVELDEASLAAAIGETDTTFVTGTYKVSDEGEDVGEVEFEVRVRDETQQALAIETFSITTELEFNVPELEITGPAEILARRGGTYSVDIVAEGGIDSIFVKGFKRGTDEEVGTTDFDETSYDAIIGKSSGSVAFLFSEEEFLGYITMVVTVIDEQGAQSSEEFLVFNELNCAYHLDDFTGDFSANEPGYGDYGVTFTADPLVPNRIVIDNFWDSGLTPYYEIDPVTGTVTMPNQMVSAGEGATAYTVEGSGEITLCEGDSFIGSFYVDYTIWDAEGAVADKNTHTFTR